MAKSLYVIGNSTLINVKKRKEANQSWQNQSLYIF